MIRTITQSNAATVLPIETLKKHLRVEGTAEDDLLAIYAKAAVREVEKYTGRSLGLATYTMTLSAAPDAIDIGVPNVVAVTALRIVDRDGVEHVIDPDDVTLHAGEFSSTVEPAPGEAWPASGDAWNAVEIEFTAGYQTIPDDLMAALLLTVTTLHRNRGDAQMPKGAQSIAGAYRVAGWM